MVDRIMASQSPSPNLQHLWQCHPTCWRDFERWQAEDLEVGRLSCMMLWVGCNHRVLWRERGRQEGDLGRPCRRFWEGGVMAKALGWLLEGRATWIDSSLEQSPANTFNPARPAYEMRSPEQWENKFVLWVTKFSLICHKSNGEPMWLSWIILIPLLTSPGSRLHRDRGTCLCSPGGCIPNWPLHQFIYILRFYYHLF